MTEQTYYVHLRGGTTPDEPFKQPTFKTNDWGQAYSVALLMGQTVVEESNGANNINAPSMVCIGIENAKMWTSPYYEVNKDRCGESYIIIGTFSDDLTEINFRPTQTQPTYSPDMSP